MRIERGDLGVTADGNEVVFVREGQGEVLVIDGDEARWLMVAGLPTILANVPSDRPARVQEPALEDGQIKGQLQIGEDDGGD